MRILFEKITLIALLITIQVNIAAQSKIKNNSIINVTDYNINTALMLMIDSVFNFKNTLINISYLPKKYKSSKKTDFKGLCEEITKNNYTVYISDDLSIYECLVVLCHEFTHIEQYKRNDLKRNGSSMIYKGITYNKNNSYNRLPYEIEAFKNQRIKYKQLKKLIISKTPIYAKYLGFH
jgi:hypothetical protein